MRSVFSVSGRDRFPPQPVLGCLANLELRVSAGQEGSLSPLCPPCNVRPAAGRSPVSGQVVREGLPQGRLLTIADPGAVAAPGARRRPAHTVVSEYQAGSDANPRAAARCLEPGRRYPAVYVLPVEAGNEDRWGNGLQRSASTTCTTSSQPIFVAPTFSHLPWYADHPSEPTIRQETYFLKVVLPLVEQRYPVQAEPAGRLLLGFSKSGYGALSLLLRHPDVRPSGRVGRAAGDGSAEPVWHGRDLRDAGELRPLPRDPVAGATGGELRGPLRLFLLGYGNFREQHEKTHALMLKLGMPHHYEDGPPASAPLEQRLGRPRRQRLLLEQN